MTEFWKRLDRIWQQRRYQRQENPKGEASNSLCEIVTTSHRAHPGPFTMRRCLGKQPILCFELSVAPTAVLQLEETSKESHNFGTTSPDFCRNLNNNGRNVSLHNMLMQNGSQIQEPTERLIDPVCGLLSRKSST